MSTFLSSSFGAGTAHIYQDSRVSDAAPFDVKKLREENIRLQEDLAQCQVDKEFVWSLWKKLQVASPDVTEAVALVVEREKQKTEEKDRKVLDILRLKDERILELQRVFDQQSQELDFGNHKKLELHDEVARQQTEKARIVDELTEIKRQIESEKSEYEQRNTSLMTTVDELTQTCERLQDELSKSSVEFDRVSSNLLKSEDENRAHTEEIKALKDQMNTVYTKETRLADLAKRYESQLKKITTELKSKAKELDAARRELSDLWATHHKCESNALQREAIIRQMEDLQKNTEKMLKDCDSEHAKQTDQQFQLNRKLTDELNYLRQNEQDHLNRIDSLEQRLRSVEDERDELRLHGEQTDKDSSIIDTQELQDERWTTRLYSMERENEKLRERLHDKNRVIERLSKQTEYDYIEGGSGSDTTDDINSAHQQRGGGRKHKHARSRSESGVSLKHQELVKKCKLTEAKLEQTEIRLQLKESQLDALKQAHQRRLTRLKNLLTSYKLVREQLKVAEDELGRPPKKRKLKLSRPKAKQLQQEDKDAAWNELRFVKNENKNLHVIKMNLEEQLDDMAVRASEDAANLHTLQIKVDTLDEEMKFMRRRGRNMSSTPTKKQTEDITILSDKLESCKSVIDSQQTRLEELSRDNTVLVEEKRSLKFEINSLKKGLYEKKSEMADLHAQVNRLRRNCRKNRIVSKASKHSFISPLAQKYEQVLNQSVRDMNAALAVADRALTPPAMRTERLVGQRGMEEEVEERGWVSQAEEDEYQSETLSELDIPEPADSAVSLGEVIVRNATKADIVTQDDSCQTSPALLQSLRRRLNHRVETATQQQSVWRRPQPSQPSLRDFGTSPLPWRPPVLRRRRSRPTAFSQVSSIKHRLISLQLKVKSLSETRDEAKSQAEELRITCDQLQTQISTSATRLMTQRNTIERLESELDTSRLKITDMQATAELMVPKSQAEQEKRLLEQKLRAITTELSRRKSEVQDVKLELEKSTENNSDLTDRLARLERDVTQKRTLLEDLRLKLRLAKESAKSELQELEGKTEEVERIKSIMEQSKSTMDSMKSSIKALTKDKKDYQNKFKESQTELAKKEKQLSSCQAQSHSLQKEMDSLQESARQQLVSLAAQGENAVALAQSQLVNAHSMIEQFQLLIKHLSDALIARQNHYREERQRIVRAEKQRTKREASKSKEQTNPALSQAKKRAQELLDLSASDIDDLLNSDEEDSDSETDDKSYSQYWKKENSRWVKKWEKALGTEEFVQKVTDLFVDKVDEVTNLAR